jgi:glycosyltransferase involved in cell wall biosynthesis
MKVLFAFNGPIEKDSSGNYLGNELNDTLVDRYKFFGDHVTFLIRAREVSPEDTLRLKRFRSENFSVVEVPEFNTFSLFIKNKGKIDKLVRKTVAEHDVIIARLPSYVGRKTAQYAKEMGKPYFVEAVGCAWDALWNHSWRGSIMAAIGLMQMKQVLRDAPFALYVTNEFLQRRYPSSGVQVAVSDVVHRELSDEILAKRLEKIRNRKPGEPIVLGTLAAIYVAYKGQDYVIKAVAKLKALGVPVKYLIAGRGDKTRMQTYINKLGLQNEVEIVGQINHDKVFDYLDNIDMYVQPSKQEGLPRAVVEAMSRACPSFGARTGGIPELVSPEWVFEKGDINGIVRIVKNVTNEQLESEAKRSFEEAKKYNVDILNKRRNDFFEAFKNSYTRPNEFY